MNRASTRRSFLAVLAGCTAAVGCLTHSAAAGLQRNVQPLPSPNAPRNQNVPGGLDTHPTDSPDRVPVSTVNAPQLAAMVQQLYQMTSELKQEIDRSNLKDMLPVDLIKRAHDIEKLAKSIREKARG